MTLLYLLDQDDDSGRWAPFLGARPIAELRAGAWRIRERWERALGIPAAVILSNRVSGYHELDEPAVRPIGPIRGPAVIARSDFAPADGPAPRDAELRRLTAAGRVVAWLVPDGGVWSGPAADGPAAEIAGVEIDGTFGLITALEQLLPGDCAAFGIGTGDPLPAGSTVLGNPDGVILRGA
ncbi:MAG TPA: putative sugar nucleotidyl transferase, partial [Gemmatimonadales bacterium]|nr:putative sugar nucleotidyl transferase [Gemmatimonadales bacterium]